MTRQTPACDEVAAWAASGAMALTGEPDGPPRVEPARAAAVAAASAEAFAEATALWGRGVAVDGPAILGERAAIAGLARQGSVSVGGSASFVRAADGWIVLNLARPSDVAAVPALIGADIDPSRWHEVTARLKAMTVGAIIERAGLLGLAAAAPGRSGQAAFRPPAAVRWPRVSSQSAAGGGPRRSGSPRPLVVDLSALWAGPLAASLLAAAGARVIKVEGISRPDGARRGPRVFFDLLNAHKRCVALDFDSAEGRRLLVSLMRAADLVLEGSRPRVMDRLGIDPVEMAHGGTSWLSVSGYGRSGPDSERVAFGDDAAVAGGLFLDGPAPGFVADAVADPLAGLQAAACGAQMLAAERASVAEVSLVGVARGAAGPALSPRPAARVPPAADSRVAARVVRDGSGWAVLTGGERVPVGEPRARTPSGSAVDHGADTAAVISELGLSS